jgi:hypothetical protein
MHVLSDDYDNVDELYDDMNIDCNAAIVLNFDYF